MGARIQRDNARNILRRVYGIQGTPSPDELDERIQAVVEVGRRGEFELLKEQGIIPFVASRERPGNAGQAAHMYVMASLIGGNRYHVVVERVQFHNSALIIVRGFVGTSLGSTASALIVARDARFTSNQRTDFSQLVQVQDGETAVIPPAVGSLIWTGPALANTLLTWEGPYLLRHIDEGPGTQDQLAFQSGTLGGALSYTVFGYLVPLAHA